MKLSIARKILWVGEFTGNDQEELKKQGLIVVESLEKVSNIKLEGLVAFQFVVINVPFTEGEYLGIKEEGKEKAGIEEKLPGRVIVLTDTQNPKIGFNPRIVEADAADMSKDTVQDMMKWCWHKWLVARNGNVDM